MQTMSKGLLPGRVDKKDGRGRVPKDQYRKLVDSEGSTVRNTPQGVRGSMAIKRLMRYEMVYVMSPYTDYYLGLDEAAAGAERVVAALMENGIRAYSPIVFGHRIQKVTRILKYDDHPAWLKHDEWHINRTPAAVIAAMSGWEKSEGINSEIDLFRAADKPIYLITDAHVKHDCEAVVWAWDEFAADHPHLRGR